MMKVKATIMSGGAMANMPLRMVTNFNAQIGDILSRNGFETIHAVATAYEGNEQAFTRLKGFKPYMQDWLHNYLVVSSYVVEVKPEPIESQPETPKASEPPKAKADVKKKTVTKSDNSPIKSNKIDNK